MKKQNKLAVGALAVAMIATSSMAYFTDRVGGTFSSESGTLCLTEVHTAHDLENMAPGDMRDIKFTYENNGTLAMDTRITYILDVETNDEFIMGENGENIINIYEDDVFLLQRGADENKPSKITVDGPTIQGATDKVGEKLLEKTLGFELDNLVSNGYQDSTFRLDVIIEGKQNKNDAEWDVINTKTITINGEQVDVVDVSLCNVNDTPDQDTEDPGEVVDPVGLANFKLKYNYTAKQKAFIDENKAEEINYVIRANEPGVKPAPGSKDKSAIKTISEFRYNESVSGDGEKDINDSKFIMPGGYSAYKGLMYEDNYDVENIWSSVPGTLAISERVSMKINDHDEVLIIPTTQEVPEDLQIVDLRSDVIIDSIVPSKWGTAKERTMCSAWDKTPEQEARCKEIQVSLEDIGEFMKVEEEAKAKAQENLTSQETKLAKYVESTNLFGMTSSQIIGSPVEMINNVKGNNGTFARNAILVLKDAPRMEAGFE